MSDSGCRYPLNDFKIKKGEGSAGTACNHAGKLCEPICLSRLDMAVKADRGEDSGKAASLSLLRVEMIMFLHICQDAGLTEWQTFGT